MAGHFTDGLVRTSHITIQYPVVHTNDFQDSLTNNRRWIFLRVRMASHRVTWLKKETDGSQTWSAAQVHELSIGLGAVYADVQVEPIPRPF